MNYYGNSSPNDYWNYLAHYGVKGMRWKNRRTHPGFREENDAVRNPLNNSNSTYNGHYLPNRKVERTKPRNARFRTETGVPNSSHKVQTHRFNGNTRNARFRENMGMDQPFNKYARNTRSAQETSSGGSIKNTYKMAALKAASKSRNHTNEEKHQIVAPPQSHWGDKRRKRAHDKPYGRR